MKKAEKKESKKEAKKEVKKEVKKDVKKEVKKEVKKGEKKEVKKGTKTEVKKEAKKEAKKEEKKAAPEEKKEAGGPKTVALTDLAEFLKGPRPNKWYTFVDRTKGNVSTFFKYTGTVIYAYSEDDMKDEKLNNLMASIVLHGMKLYIDFGDVEIPFEKYIHTGAFPAEIFSPTEVRSEKLFKLYKDPAAPTPLEASKTGEIGFIFTNEAAVPQWAKDKTALVYVNP